MFIRSSPLWVLLTLLATHQVTSDSCEIVNIDKINDRCTAQITCINEVKFDIKTWECIQSTKNVEKYEYDSYYGRYRNVWRKETTYDEHYYLFINIEQPHQNSSLLYEENHYLKLILKQGDIISIPEDVFKMVNLVWLSISDNNIPAVKLDKFLALPYLSEIILENNMIQHIEISDEKESLFGNKNNVQEIDMSHNLIESLPNNFAAKFSALQDLDLSHNMINNIGLLTFEGIKQLQTLDLSYNRLSNIGYALARFTNLKFLSVSHNNISKLNEQSFETLSNLEKLNISFNIISKIDNDTFKSLSNLKSLDLRHNRLRVIYNYLFSGKIYLKTLLLTDNLIQSIEKNSFINTNITEFTIDNNPLIGHLQPDTFEGVNVASLNLSGANLTSLEDMAFAKMVNLNNLNLSCNFINNLSFAAFSSLASLKTLDLSYNQIKNFSIDSFNLGNVTHLYVQHNYIKKITSSVFQNFISLIEIDLSDNSLQEIEPDSFLGLNNVTYLTVKRNPFVHVLESRTFNGLVSLNKLDMSETNTTRFANESFYGLSSLIGIDCAFGQLTEIEYNTFLGTGRLEWLNLSNNQLHNFCINVSTIQQIQEIYLNNNFITIVSNKTFSDLKLLRVLNMANNNILKLNSDVFQNSNALTYLDFTFNKDMTVIGNPFKEISNLYSLTLLKVKNGISFENSTASIEILNLQSCKIRNINKINVFNVQGLAYLNLSINEITYIDKDSFREIPSLVSLDLSFNKISFIQPGSFLHTTSLTSINLHVNYLPAIQFGVFDGIDFLLQLDISNNILSKLDVKLLPDISRVFLDNNLITEISFESVFDTHITELSIGGNQISCQVLAELKSSNYSDKFKRIVTTKNIDYHLENVNGITCQTTANFTTHKNNITNIPINNINISPLIASLRNVLDKLEFNLQAITENSNATKDLKNKEEYILQTLQTIIESNTKTQTANGDYLSKLTEINNESNKQLEDIKKYLMDLVDKNNNKKELDYESNTKSSIGDQNLRKEFQQMLKQGNDALRQEFKNALADIYSTSKPVQPSLISNQKDFSDSKAVIYFMAVCLAIILAVYVGNVVLKQVLVSRRPHGSRLRPATLNSIEME